MAKLAVSLLEADFRFLADQLTMIKEAGGDYIHIDVMDGLFVPNLAFGMKEIEGIRKASDLFFDVHMMVHEPIRYVEEIAEAGADLISVHLEACSDPAQTIKKIQELKVGAGIVLNPETHVEELSNDLIEMVDVVQLMTVRPGVKGERFIDGSVEKIRKLKAKIDELHILKEIEVDGNIGVANVGKVVNAGATIIVSGRALFEGNLKQNIGKMKRLITVH